jgi:hypothetical protein
MTPATSEEVIYRAATPHDIEAIARLHADSWRRHYRGALPDAYLDGDLVAERLSVWTDRLRPQRADTFTIVAEHIGSDPDPGPGDIVGLTTSSRMTRPGVRSWTISTSPTPRSATGSAPG